MRISSTGLRNELTDVPRVLARANIRWDRILILTFVLTVWTLLVRLIA